MGNTRTSRTAKRHQAVRILASTSVLVDAIVDAILNKDKRAEEQVISIVVDTKIKSIPPTHMAAGIAHRSQIIDHRSSSNIHKTPASTRR